MNATTKYGFLNATYWMAFCSIYGFASFYLLGIGLTSSQIGIIIAIGSILAFILQPIFASWADRTHTASLDKIMIGLSTFFLIGVIALLFTSTYKLITGIIFVALISTLLIMIPLTNAVSGRFESHNIPIDFGIARSSGSIVYALMSIILGGVAINSSPKVVVYVGIIVTLLLILSLLSFPIPFAADHDPKASATGMLQFIKDYPYYMGIAFGVTCIFFFHTISNIFIFQILKEYGGTSKDMGIALAIAAFTEVPMFFFYTKINRHFPCDKLLKWSGFFYAIKALLLYLATSILMVEAQQFLQMFAFALFTAASVQYVNKTVAPKDRVKGQALLTTANTLGAMASSLAGGYLLDNVGVHTTLLVCLIVTIMGLASFLIFVKKLPQVAPITKN